jgi:hypothetical protein
VCLDVGQFKIVPHTVQYDRRTHALLGKDSPRIACVFKAAPDYQIKNECEVPILWLNVFGSLDVKDPRGERYT